MSAAGGGDANGPEPILEIPVDGELDLHAFAPADVAQVVRDYVEACRERGVVHLRLVHGRGKGVQRARVRHVLGSIAGIVEIRDASPAAGGWGATLARLEPLPSVEEAARDREVQEDC